MREARYTPQMFVATVCVLILPAVVVSILHDRGKLTSFWLGIVLGLALTFVALSIGTAYWRRRKRPATVLFSELLVWGWIRHQYLDHKINSALHSFARLRPGESERRKQLLVEIAAAVEAKDPFLYGHSRRVARYVTRVAGRMHLDRAEVARLRTAALLHDVGKLHTPPEVLLQPHALTADDYTVMQRHAADGADMVAGLGDRELAAVVRHHHERFDGAGYPDGLKGDSIPLGSRIIAVPDTFDAITSRRPYREGRPHKQALTVLRDEAGKQFDPAVVRAFLAEYTDRRGAMIWAAAGQLLPVLRVGAVAGAAITLTAASFAATSPRAHVQPRSPLATRQGSAPTPTGSAGIHRSPAPRTAATAERRQRTAAAQRAQARVPVTPPSLTVPALAVPAGAATARAAPTSAVSALAGPLLAGRQPASVTPPSGSRTPASTQPTVTQPVSSRPRPGSTLLALAPQAEQAYSKVGKRFTEPSNLAMLTNLPQTSALPIGPTSSPPTLAPTPTTPASPTTPTSPTPPPTATAPATPTTPATPTPPSTSDQCKNGGWQTLGYKNQGQCIAATKKG